MCINGVMVHFEFGSLVLPGVPPWVFTVRHVSMWLGPAVGGRLKTVRYGHPGALGVRSVAVFPICAVVCRGLPKIRRRQKEDFVLVLGAAHLRRADVLGADLAVS